MTLYKNIKKPTPIACKHGKTLTLTGGGRGWIFISFIVLFFFPTILKSQDTLTIQTVIEIVLKNNYDILISNNNAQIANNNNSLGNAGFLPIIGTDGSQTNNIYNTHQKYSDGRVKDVSDAKTSALSARLMLNWTVFDGLSMFASKQKLQQLDSLGETQYKQTVQNSINQSIAVYYNIVQQQKVLNALSNALQISNERLRLAQTKLKIGSGSDLTMLQAQLDRNADSSEYIQQQVIIHNTKSELNRLMVLNDSIDFTVSENIPINSNLNFDELYSKTLKQNPQLIAAQINWQIASQNIKLARALYLPKISVFAGYSISNTTSQAGFYEVNRGQGPIYGVSATFNIFNGFNDKRNIQNSKLQYLSSEYNFKQTELEVKSEFQKLFNEYHTQLKLVNLEEENAKAAHKSTNLSFEMYKQGMMSDIDFRTAQQKQINADIRLLSAQYLAKIKETQLLLLCGELNGRP